MEKAPSSFKGLQSTYYYFFKGAGSAMAIADKEGILVASNDRFNELIKSLSGSQIDITGNTARLGSSFDFLPIHDAIRFSNLLSRLTNEDSDRMEFKTPYRDKQNKIHWFKIHAWKMIMDPRVELSDRGPFIGFIMNDETVETEAEEKLQEDMKVAEKAMEAKNRFLAVMSHEIRTPIQTIIGMTELLGDSSLSDKQAGYVSQTAFSADILLSLVNDILDYSKIEAGKMELEHIPFSPGRILKQASEMFSLESRKKGIDFVLKTEKTEDAAILGDPGKFRQVVINLVKNAVKFTSSGTITIHAAVKPGADFLNRTITVSVADTGIGVAEEARERLFTTFMQADSSHTRRFGGTGLGLAISRDLVELMGGTIEMLPNPGGGSIFRFTIPAEEAPGASPDVSADTVDKPYAELIDDFVVPSEKTTAPADCQTAPVMVVEDHEVNRHIFTMILKNLGVPVIEAHDGYDALEKISADAALVFMDIQMPRLNGCEAAAELRRRGFTMPLVAVTAAALEDEQRQYREAGFDDILPKPCKRADIEAMYRKWTGRTPVSGAASTALSGGKAAAGEAAGGSEAEVPVFNGRDLLDTFMNEKDAAAALLVRFINRSAEQLESLSGPAAANREEAYRIAHTIKGTAMTMSGMELGRAADRLGKAYKENDDEAAASALPLLKEAFARFRKAAESWLEAASGGEPVS